MAAFDPGAPGCIRPGRDTIGWAIGTDGWRQSLAKELRQTALEPGLHLTEVRELREHGWDDAVMSALSKLSLSEGDLANRPLGQDWKFAVAAKGNRPSL